MIENLIIASKRYITLNLLLRIPFEVITVNRALKIKRYIQRVINYSLSLLCMSFQDFFIKGELHSILKTFVI